MERLILHYDMDAFYASVEIRDNPHLKNKPVIIGRSVVTTCNYEARKYGLHSAMSISEAKKLCPFGVYLAVDKDKYNKESEKIHELIHKLSNKVEFIALDEGYIDISEYKDKYINLEEFADKFIKRIYENTKLTCSLGIGYNKLSAKLASEVNKPNGFYIIRDQSDFRNYIYNKDIKILPGVGKKTQEILRTKGINLVSDILTFSLLELQGLFGHIRGQLLYEYALGIDMREVSQESQHKSIGNETTFKMPTNEIDYIHKNLDDLFEKVYLRFKNKKYFGKTITIKIKYADRSTFTRSKSLFQYTNSKIDLSKAYELIKDELNITNSLILVGVSISNIIEEKSEQLSFESVSKLKKKKKIAELKGKMKKIPPF